MACYLHRYHAPEPQGLHRHHIVPVAWTTRLGLTESATVDLCPTGHDNVHRDLRAALSGRPWNASTDGKELVSTAVAFYEAHPESQPYLRTMAEELVEE